MYDVRDHIFDGYCVCDDKPSHCDMTLGSILLVMKLRPVLIADDLHNEHYS
jgi:hypothetical protein